MKLYFATWDIVVYSSSVGARPTTIQHLRERFTMTNDLAQMVEEINDAFFKMVEAKEKCGYLCIVDKRVDPFEADLEMLEDSLADVVDFVEQEFNVTLEVVQSIYRTMVYKVYEF